MMKTQYIIGIDEAGRGPLAGPVAVGIVVVSVKKYGTLKRYFAHIKGKDSKKLSPKERCRVFEQMSQLMKDGELEYAVSFVGASLIDRRGIVWAINECIKRCLKRLAVNPRNSHVTLDGGLKAPAQFIRQETIIKGDEKELCIGLASIAAKVLRDHKMERLARKYPEYGFDRHKGYGTKQHRAMITQHGPIREHRKTFIRSIYKQ